MQVRREMGIKEGLSLSSFGRGCQSMMLVSQWQWALSVWGTEEADREGAPGMGVGGRR